MTSTSGTFAMRDPVTDALSDVAEWGQEFNKTQPRLQIDYRLDDLQELLLAARTREREIAESLVDTLASSGREIRLKPARRLEVSLGRPVNYGKESMWGPTLTWKEFASPSGDEEVSVTWSTEERDDSVFAEEPSTAGHKLASGSGVATGVIADWLGYSHDDIQLVGGVIFPWDEPSSPTG